MKEILNEGEERHDFGKGYNGGGGQNLPKLKMRTVIDFTKP